MKKPNILVSGRNPDCIHVEYIRGVIGTCQVCGQVRDYGPCFEEGPDEFFSKKGRIGGIVLQHGKGAEYAALYSN